MMNEKDFVSSTADGARLMVRVQPRAKKNELCGIMQNALKIRLTAPPVGGAANKALIRFLAKQLHVRQTDIEIVSGHSGRIKTIEISGLSTRDIHTLLKV